MNKNMHSDTADKKIHRKLIDRLLHPNDQDIAEMEVYFLSVFGEEEPDALKAIRLIQKQFKLSNRQMKILIDYYVFHIMDNPLSTDCKVKK